MASERPPVIGNRIVLMGAIVYLLEWAAIVPVGEGGPSEPGTQTAEELVELYARNPQGQAFLAGWFSLVLLGRIAVVVGIRSAVRQSPQPLPLAEVAVGAMAVSVVVEIVAYAIVAAVGYLAAQGSDASLIAALDAVGGFTVEMIWAPLGVSVLLGAAAMLRSRFFPGWMCWLGMVSGAMITVLGVLAGRAYGETGTWFETLVTVTQPAVAGFWLWMLVTGVFLFRRAPHLRAAPVAT